ncbi:MAG TPA: hypothetical protein PLI05_10200 [Methanotrichaceae archaeon]|nr:hypothetical protein [Methanotrichaceae archaeon]HQI92182.1 hypothetical protein [Methanotrichaceae archaeon]
MAKVLDFRDGFNGDPYYMDSIATVPTVSNLSYNLKELYDFEFYMFEEIVFR